MYKIPARTLFLGKNLVFMPECHSTNTIALELCQQTPIPAEGTVIVTANQTAGRGQRGNTWFVEPGKNLTFSIILHPAFLALSEQFYLNIMFSLAICDFLEQHGCSDVKVKWPNDIYVRQRKIAGILIESQVMGKRVTSSVIGIGLNVNQQVFNLPTATSLSLESGLMFDLSHELEELLAFIEPRFLQLKQRHYPELKSDYLSRMYWRNEKHTFESDLMGRFTGAIAGIAESGQLIIEVEGEEREFGVKGVSYIE